jgi:hypothetical protein
MSLCHLKIELFFKQIRTKWFIYKQGQTIHNMLCWYLIFFIFYDLTVMHASKRKRENKEMKVKYEDRGCNINTLKTYDSTILVYRQTKAEIVGESIYESTNTPNVYLQCVGIFFYRSRVNHS